MKVKIELPCLLTDGQRASICLEADLTSAVLGTRGGKAYITKIYEPIIHCGDTPIVSAPTIAPLKFPHPYQASLTKCKCCNRAFVLAEGEKHWYRERNLELPRRCKECRVAREKAKKDEQNVGKVTMEECDNGEC